MLTETTQAEVWTAPSSTREVAKSEDFHRGKFEAARRKLHRQLGEMWIRATQLAKEIERRPGGSRRKGGLKAKRREGLGGSVFWGCTMYVFLSEGGSKNPGNQKETTSLEGSILKDLKGDASEEDHSP